jgi:hypothetical protein
MESRFGQDFSHVRVHAGPYGLAGLYMRSGAGKSEESGIARGFPDAPSGNLFNGAAAVPSRTVSYSPSSPWTSLNARI